MGTYLSTPNTEKCHESGESSNQTDIPVRWAVVDMQGWRKSMEDSHIAVSDIPVPIPGAILAQSQQNPLTTTTRTSTTPTETNSSGGATNNNVAGPSDSSDFNASVSTTTMITNSTSELTTINTTDAKVFGVFDGHGGAEVARFCSLYLVSVLQQQLTWKAMNSTYEPRIDGNHNPNTEIAPFEGDAIGQALIATFHALDRMIDDPNRKEELFKLRQMKPQPGETRKAEFIPPPIEMVNQTESVSSSSSTTTNTTIKTEIQVNKDDTKVIEKVENEPMATETSPLLLAAASSSNREKLKSAESSSSENNDTSYSFESESAKTLVTDETVASTNSSNKSSPRDGEQCDTKNDDDDEFSDFEDADSHEAVGLDEVAEERENTGTSISSGLDDDEDENDQFDDAVKDLEDVVIEVEGGDDDQHSDQQNSTAGSVSTMLKRLLNLSVPTGQVVMQIGNGVDSVSSSTTDATRGVINSLQYPTDTENTNTASSTSSVTASNPSDIVQDNNTLSNSPPLSSVKTSPPTSSHVAVSPAPYQSTLFSASTMPSVARNGQMFCNLQDHPIHAGATAIVAVLIGRTLTVANAGDSRAVLCRGRNAIPLSMDHKPMQERELNRIRSAGGFVNSFGRVNGNLNLSRSLGDLKYKQVAGLRPEEQIITAQPDIRQLTLHPDDEFLILGCDGIWDCLTNEKAVEFVWDRIHHKSLTDIGVEMLNTIISDDPRMTQGIGGDNMTILIVDLQPYKRHVARAPESASIETNK